MKPRRTSSRFARAALAMVGMVSIATLCAPAATAQESPAPAGSADCGQTDQEPGSSARHQISSGDRQREFVLHLPSSYDGETELPVVLAFHGHGSTAADIEEFSKLSSLPAIVAYPEGAVNEDDEQKRQSWQGAPYSPSGVDDVAFVGDLLDHLEQTACVDTDHVYATGISNGGGFTGLLACEMSDRIAAVAPVAGAFYPETSEGCQSGGSIPVLEFHGTADPSVPYDGGVRDLPAIPDWMADWAERNDCQSRAADEQIEPDITVNRWVDCAGGAEVRHVAVDGGGHTWPGADSRSGSGETTQTIEAHEVIWDFVSRYQLSSSS